MDPITAIFYAIYSSIEIAGIGLSSWAAGGLAIASTFATAYMLSRAMAGSVSDSSGAGAFRFAQQTTENQGGPVQVSYGTRRIHANIVGHYTVVPTTDTVTRGSAVTREILACFGEGPWSAEPDDSTMRINGRPMTDWPGVTAQWRLGTVDQTVLDEWTTFRQDFNVGQALTNDSPTVTYTLSRTGWDDLAIHVAFPNGLVHYGTDGHRHGEPVQFLVEVGDAIADTWQTLVAKTVTGEIANACYVSWMASETYTGGSPMVITPAMQPRIRVTKLTSDSTNSRHVRDCEVSVVQMSRNVGFRHAGMVLLGLSLVPNEATESGLSELSVVTEGKIVVTGYDDGGNAVFGTTQSHADAIRDVLIQPVIEGDGTEESPYSMTYYRGINPARLIGDGWDDQKTLAAVQVPDGAGGYADMLQCDIVFSSSTNAHAAIQQIAAGGRCGLQCIGRDFGLWADTPRVPVGLMCDGNWTSGGDPDPVPGSDLAAEASVRYEDESCDYQERSIYVIDHEMNTLTEVTIDLAAVTRMHEAARTVRRELARNRLVDGAMTCEADLDSVIYEAGDVLYSQVNGKSLGGRVTAVDGLQITVDRDIDEVVTGTDGMILQHRVTGAYYAPEYLDAHRVSARVVQLSGSPAVTVQVGDLYLFGPSTIQDDQYEVTDCSLDAAYRMSITMARYAPGLDDLDALDPDVDVSIPTGQGSYGGTRPWTVDPDATGSSNPTFTWGGYTFAAAGGGSIAWTSDLDDDGDQAGFVNYGGVLSVPADGSTTKLYVYWDPDTPTVFSATDAVADLTGNYLIAVNDSGVPVVKPGTQIGGEGGLISIDDLLDGTAYKKMTAAQATKLDTLDQDDVPDTATYVRMTPAERSALSGVVSAVSGLDLDDVDDSATYVRMTPAERTALSTVVSDLSNLKTDLQSKFLQIG